jgi:hypothetical protein
MFCRKGLTTVEEIDTKIAIENIPSTPPRHEASTAILHPSPGALSEMSGTTAISSFTMVEADLLEPRIMMRKLPKLYEVLEEFMNHLVPEDAQIEDDHKHIRNLQMPDSDFSADYRVYDEEATIHLNHFRGEHQRYIQLRAVRRAFLGPNRDSDASQCGLDLVLYMANLLIFAKQMIHSNRGDKDTFTVLRELENLFPSLFLPKLISGGDPSSSQAGDSALLQETFELALELRTQFAIIVLERSSSQDSIDPEGVLDDVFFQSGALGSHALIQGWSVSALGGEESTLPRAFEDKVIERINVIREFFPTDDESIQRGDFVDLDGLGANFPWDSLVLRLLGWVRLRNRELQSAIGTQGGIANILAKLKAEMEQPDAVVQAASALRESPRKKRSSFGRNRRRSSRKFDPNADINTLIVDKLIAKERGSTVLLQASKRDPQPESLMPREAPAVLPPSSKHNPQPEREIQEEVPTVPEEQVDWEPPIDYEMQRIDDDVEEPGDGMADPSQPPQSTADHLKLWKQGKKPDKENRATSFFDRQPTARRVEFGDGFDTQPTPESSSKSKHPQPSPKKRPRAVTESDSDDDVFETRPRNNARVQQQREQVKRFRAAPTSSVAPPSHQPRTRDEDVDFQPPAQEDSPSEPEALERMQDAPPRSTYAEQRDLARVNFRTLAGKQRKPRAEWTEEAEEALAEYMALYPRGYSAILKHDRIAHGLLQDRTQINLKDKVRNMAIIMIK